MKHNILWLALSIVMVFVLIFVSCTAETTPTPTPTKPPTTSSPRATPEANWWDEFGEPEYGGTITRAVITLPSGFDPYNWQQAQNSNWFEPLWLPNWTEDPSSGVFAHMWVPAEHWAGNLAEKWEWSDPTTLVVHLRQGVKWQNKPPVNGREFTSDDVIFHFDRMFGTGEFTEDGPNPFYVGRFAACESVTASDKYTVTFKFKQPNEFINANAIMNEPILQFFEAREVYEMGTPIQGTTGINSALNDWQNQVGTGPFIMTDFVDNASQILERNPDYWAYDERHPDNQLPYVDSIKVLCIPDQSTQLASLRTGKIDIAVDVPLEQALSLQDTNPELLYETYASPGSLLQLRCDTEPFDDIRVRKALQLAVNLPELAETYYKGTVDWKPVGVINPAYTGFATPYDDWPQELKDEYAYNPEKAKQLLAEAGYPNGFSTNVLAAAGGPGGDLQLLQVLKSYFKAINVDMEIDAQPDFWAVMQMLMAKKHDQMAAMGLSDDTPPQMGMRFYIAAEPTNGLCQNDPTWEALVEAVTNATDKASTQAACVEADNYWLRQHWVVTTFPLNKYVFWQPYIKGYSGEKADSWSFSALGLPRFWISK